MSKFPSKPQKGQPALQAIYNSLVEVIDYLPTLTVIGDNKTTSVNHSSYGTTIHAIQPNTTIQNKKGVEYQAGSGISITSGNIINAFLSAGPNIKIYSNSGALVISGTPAGEGGGGGDTNTTYIGEKQATCSCGFIYVDPNPISGDTHVIYSTLRYIGQLYNFPIDSETTPEYEHFLQVPDLKAGAGTEINWHYSSKGDHTVDGGGPDTLVKWIDGIEVDLNVSGGTYITTNFHKGVGYGDQTSASIDCNLSGDRDAYATGYITIVPQRDLASNITGGIISTILHGDGSTISIDSNGTISCLVEGGGGGGPDTNTTYTGELDVPYSDGGCPCGFIHVGQTPFSGDTHIIYSTLRNLYQLGNEGITSNNHFVQAADIKSGIGTEINFHYNVDTPTATFIDGFEVDLNISGGNFITTNLTRNQDQVSASIDCNLSGDRDAYATGLISIIPQRDLASNITGGIISTCLHGDESTIHVDQGTGEISCLVQGNTVPNPVAGRILSADANGMTWQPNNAGGGGGGFFPNYDNLADDGGNRIYVQTDYTAPASGGWIRISSIGYTEDCCSLYVNNKHIGLGKGQYGTANTWILPIPPNAHFYVQFPDNETYVYFDGAGTYTDYTDEFGLSTIQIEYSRAYNARNYASTYANRNEDNYNNYVSEPEDYSLNSESWYHSNWMTASGYADDAIAAYNRANYNFSLMDPEGGEYSSAEYYIGEISNYKDESISAAVRAYDYYLSANTLREQEQG